MKGLLLKDAYQIWHYAKGVIVAAVVMMSAGVVTIMNGANFFIVYAGFLMGMMPMTLLAYDQASKFSEYSGVLPVTKEQLVGSKYIIGLCGLVLAEAFAAAALGVAQLHWAAVDSALVISTLVQVGMTTLLGSTILLPLSYRFGYEKAKYAFYLVVGLVAALMGFGVSANEDGLVRNLLPQSISSLGLLGIAVVTLALYAASWRLSVAWYGKAEQ
jgi:ABC-2 type transport system permease protein